MPIFSSSQIPPPKNWQDFEDLCCDLWRAIWKDPNTQKNGRQGQIQHGVDIYGRPNQETLWAGVQCKGKGNYNNELLTEQEVENEVVKAKSFEPKLSEFIIATTAPKDIKIETLARKITEKHLRNDLFSVHIWGWEDIVNRLGDFPNVIEKHYNWLYQDTKTTEEKNRKTTQTPNREAILPYTVFISYATEDENSAVRLCQDLTSAGIKVWIAKKCLLPGQDWKIAIEEAIQSSRYFIALLSNTSVSKTGFVRKELKIALNVLERHPKKDIFIIPVRLDNCKPSHDRIKDLHWVDMFPDWEQGFQKILLSIREPLSSQDSKSAVQIDNETSKQLGRHEYTYMLWYDIFDSTGNRSKRNAKDARTHQDKIEKLKTLLNDGFHRLSIEARRNSCEIYCWNGGESSIDDAKHVFLNGKFAHRYIVQILSMLLKRSNSLNVKMRIYIVPCNLSGTSVYRWESDTEVIGETFWEHWSRLYRDCSQYESSFIQDSSFLVITTSELIERLQIYDEIKQVNLKETAIASEIGLLTKTTKVLYGGVKEVAKIGKENLLDELHEHSLPGSSTELHKNPQAMPLQLINEFDMYGSDEKKRIAKYVVSNLIEPETTIFLDAGSTVRAIANEIFSQSQNLQGLAIVTNNMEILDDFRKDARDGGTDAHSIVSIGGEYSRSHEELWGRKAESSIQDLNLHTVIMGVSGIDFEHGLFCHGPVAEEVVKKAIFQKQAFRRIIAADYSKIGQRDAISFGSVESLVNNVEECFIITSTVPKELSDDLRERYEMRFLTFAKKMNELAQSSVEFKKKLRIIRL